MSARRIAGIAPRWRARRSARSRESLIRLLGRRLPGALSGVAASLPTECREALEPAAIDQMISAGRRVKSISLIRCFEREHVTLARVSGAADQLN
jgi:hypothetical protein